MPIMMNKDIWDFLFFTTLHTYGLGYSYFKYLADLLLRSWFLLLIGFLRFILCEHNPDNSPFGEYLSRENGTVI